MLCDKISGQSQLKESKWIHTSAFKPVKGKGIRVSYYLLIFRSMFSHSLRVRVGWGGGPHFFVIHSKILGQSDFFLLICMTQLVWNGTQVSCQYNRGHTGKIDTWKRGQIQERNHCRDTYRLTPCSRSGLIKGWQCICWLDTICWQHWYVCYDVWNTYKQ